MEIRTGIFQPDNARGGRVRADAVPLDRVQFFADQLEQPAEVVESEPESNLAVESMQSEDKPWHKISEISLDAPVEVSDDGHVTTDSSDSSEGEAAWAPVVGHYTITVPDSKSLWRNQNSKMYHLSEAEHFRVLLCGRRIGTTFSVTKARSGTIRQNASSVSGC